MEMRLGKTLVAIRWAEAREPRGFKLVVAPSTVLTAWARELELEGLEYVLLSGTTLQKRKQYAGAAEYGVAWCLINPEGLRAYPDLCEMTWDVCIVDESTLMKNPRAKITRLIRKRLRDVPNRAILSGMPCPEGEHGLYSQMAWVMGGSWMGQPTFWHWRLKYMEPTAFSWEVTMEGRCEIEDAMKEDAFCMTCERAGVFSPVVEETVRIELEPEIMRDYRNVEKKWILRDESTRISLTAQAWCRQLAAGIPAETIVSPGKVLVKPTRKHRYIADVVADELRRDRAIVWTNFIAESDGVSEALRDRGLHPIVVRGGVKDRAGLLEQFRKAKPGRRPLVISETIGRFGIDLSAGTAMIYASNAWDWETRGQTRRRCDAVGKGRPTLIMDVVSAGTVDEDVVEILAGKGSRARDFAKAMSALAHTKRGAKL